VGVAAVLQLPNQNCKKHTFVENILLTNLRDPLLSRNKPQTPVHDRSSAIFENKEITSEIKLKFIRILL
jgi:hypothetical protein